MLSTFILSVVCLTFVHAAPQLRTAGTVTADQPQVQSGQGAPSPIIDWGKCPELAPKESEKEAKAEIIRSCINSIPLPKNLTQESIETHRTEVAKCALSKEDWFTPEGRYKFEKAESEVKNKGLKADIEASILAQHAQCRNEAEKTYQEPQAIIPQVQLYQACMDYHISQICSIQIQIPQPQASASQ